MDSIVKTKQSDLNFVKGPGVKDKDLVLSHNSVRGNEVRVINGVQIATNDNQLRIFGNLNPVTTYKPKIVPLQKGRRAADEVERRTVQTDNYYGSSHLPIYIEIQKRFDMLSIGFAGDTSLDDFHEDGS